MEDMKLKSAVEMSLRGPGDTGNGKGAMSQQEQVGLPNVLIKTQNDLVIYLSLKAPL